MNAKYAIGLIPALFLGCDGDDFPFGPGNALISEPFEFQRDAAGRVSFELTGINGNVEIRGQSQGETIRITGFRRVQSCSEAAARLQIDNLRVVVDESAEAVAVETSQPQDTGSCSLSVDYTVTMPERLFAAIANVNGNITLDDLDNGATVVNVNGNVGGEVDIEDNGTIALTTVNGNVDLTVKADIDAQLSANLVNGQIRVMNLTVANQTSTMTSLTGTLGDGEGSIQLRTTNGNITIGGR